MKNPPLPKREPTTVDRITEAVMSKATPVQRVASRERVLVAFFLGELIGFLAGGR